MMQPEIAFLSYSREDSEFAMRLARELKATGALVWMDQLDIEPGVRWAHATEQAISGATRMLVVLSPASVASASVANEYLFALEEKKRVIPILHRDCKIPFQLRPLQYADFRTDFATGLASLLRVMRGAEAASSVAFTPSAEDISEVEPVSAVPQIPRQPRVPLNENTTEALRPPRASPPSVASERAPDKDKPHAAAPRKFFTETKDETTPGLTSRMRRAWLIVSVAISLTIVLVVWSQIYKSGSNKIGNNVVYVNNSTYHVLKADECNFDAPAYRGTVATTDNFPRKSPVPLIGRFIGQFDFDASTRSAIAVVSDRLWSQSCGSDPSIVGKSLLIDGRSYTIVGVLQPGVVRDPQGNEVDLWFTK